MTWLGDHWLDLLGWGGSALLVFSLLQTRVLRFRVLNLIACVVLVVFNAVIPVWPMVGMNLVLTAINLWFIVSLLRHRHDQAAFQVLAVHPDDAYLGHFLTVHARDIAHTHPDFARVASASHATARHAFLVLRGDEAVGVVQLRVEGGVGHIELDYVTQRFRDLSPGEFVWRRSSLLTDLGITRVESPPHMIDPYYERLGFRRVGDAFVLEP